MNTILNKSLFSVALIIFGVVFQPSLQAQVLGRGFSGAMGGAILGSLVGGREGAQAGAAIGGAVGLVQGAREKSQIEAQREAHARQQAERERIQKEQQLAQAERLKEQESAEEKFDSGTVLEIQKSLVRMGFDPGDINGQMQTATENAIRLYEQKHKLLETGRPSQELLKHMLQNGG
jgi:peptidoglycan hydrolase-like protein with peptidoglycan-binding domain